jgi:hypothetical protein
MKSIFLTPDGFLAVDDPGFRDHQTVSSKEEKILMR